MQLDADRRKRAQKGRKERKERKRAQTGANWRTKIAHKQVLELPKEVT